MLADAGADPYPPDGLFRNIWDPEELRNIVKNFGKTGPEFSLPTLLYEAASQFIKMGQTSDVEEIKLRMEASIPQR